MNVVKAALGWVGRRGLLYLLLVAAILAATFVIPFLRTEWAGPGRHNGNADRLASVARSVLAQRDDAQRRLLAFSVPLRERSLVELNDELTRARRSRQQAIAETRSTLQRMTSIATADFDAVLSDKKRELDIALYDQEIAVLQSARREIWSKQSVGDRWNEVARSTQNSAQLRANTNAAQLRCVAAATALKKFEAEWPVWLTMGLYKRQEHAALQGKRSSVCDDAKRQALLLRGAERAQSQAGAAYTAAAQSYDRAQRWSAGEVDIAVDDLKKGIADERKIVSGLFVEKVAVWAERVHLVAVLKTAGVALLSILLMPYAIRLLFFFVLAPMAARRPVIRLRVLDGEVAVIPLADRSATSVSVRLAAGEELSVRQEYLQSSSHVGAKRTQWLLDWRHPMSSIVTGLTFLTSIRGDGEMTTVSAINDPFAEVTLLEVPAGAACVLQPRALAAVAQPIGRPLRITSHWRLTSLNAWLTLQLRYLVFHGPARLVLKGGRGVRVERAERGRVFGQDQLIGFSAHLAYSVTRAETFWPYFLGREQLLKDRIEGGDGILIVEEAPLAGRKGSETRHGLEGTVDAALKVVGL